MIKRISSAVLQISSRTKPLQANYLPLLHFRLLNFFANYPSHDVLTMPALSPTMKEGKILKWHKKAGDKVVPGDIICDIETDKATLGYEVQEKGYLAKTLASQEFIPLGTPLAIVVKREDYLKQFDNYAFGKQQAVSTSNQASTPKEEPKVSQKSSPSKTYPAHTLLKMPAVSPTMTEGKILKWKIQPGDAFVVGDALFSIQTDKAVVDYEATEKGVLAKVIVAENQSFPVGQNVAVVVKKKQLISEFSDFSDSVTQTAKQIPKNEQKIEKEVEVKSSKSNNISNQVKNGDKIFASPLAKKIANQKGIELSLLKGSGPDGRIIRQDVESYTPPAVITSPPVTKSLNENKPPKSNAFLVPSNPYEEVPLNGMRKTIAQRLSQSKQTVPHYYITTSVEMDIINALRNELNKNQKENGVKISVNDMIVKATALALRDYPNVNAQWQGQSIRKFKHADISIAVAVDGGLITPIVFRAQTLGLIEIAKRTKDIAKRAREGKLDPLEYIGGTSTISNLGMYGIDTVSSIINVPQASILGIGKTQKKILFDPSATDPSKPYRVAEVMEINASVDHRAVDGALAAQWLMRVKKYLENPTQMLL